VQSDEGKIIGNSLSKEPSMLQLRYSIRYP